MRTGSSVLAFLLGCGFTAVAAGEDYDYQVNLTYAWGQLDSTSVSTLNGVPTPSLGTSTTSSDSDSIDLTGAWFYSRLSDSTGPKSRAAFLSRASSVVMGYSRSDESSSFEFSGGGVLPPVSGNADTIVNELSLDLRHVWQGSGWYLLAGISRAEFEFDNTSNGGSVFSTESDANRYRLGAGKYLGMATTLELGVTTLDFGGSNSTAVALGFSHVGSIGTNWQYGADVAFAKSDTGGDGDSFALRGSLFPTASIEFGLGFSRQERNSGFDLDSIEAFAGWFVRDNVELTALYRLDEPDTGPGQDVDSDEFGVGLKVRF